MISPQITKLGFKIVPVEQQDIDIAEKGERRTNVVQITFKDLALMWDLKEHKEVLFINKLEEFDTSDTYVVTGFRPYLHSKKLADLSNASFF
jgi:hypothetical protein